MMANNYDNSGSGWNCNLHVMLEEDEGRRIFEEEMHVHCHNGYATTAVYEFGIHESDPIGCIQEMFEFSDDLTERDYRRALFNVYMNQTPMGGSWKPTPREFFYAHRGYGINGSEWEDAFMDELEDSYVIEYAKEDSLPLIDELPDDKVKHKFRVITTTGSSQGDYAHVLIPNIHEWDTTRKDAIDKAIGHICWDQPIYARLEVECQETGEVDEIFLTEFLRDCYAWDRDKIIQCLKELGTDKQGEAVTRNEPFHEHVIEFVEANLPEYPTP